jgi:hypothetical protein
MTAHPSDSRVHACRSLELDFTYTGSAEVDRKSPGVTA